MILNSFLDFGSKNFLEIGNFKIAWYAVCILTGICLAAYLGITEAKKFGIPANKILDGLLICVPFAILGARLYYVIFQWKEFYEVGDFTATLLNILGFSDGSFQLAGLAINGGIIVAVIFVIIYCRVRKINMFAVFDLLAPGLLIGQICGRWGNFFNQEAHGGPISSETFNWLQYIIPPFIMDRMNIGGTYYHPTFLYESLWNAAGLIFILISRRKNKHQRIGDNICFYLIWYGLGRACLIEPFRTDALPLIPSIGTDVIFNRVNVVMNLGLAVIGVVWLILKHTVFKEPYYIEYQQQIKDAKIDGVICKLEGTLVSFDRLIMNAYYYTASTVLNKQIYEDELRELIKVKPEDYFEGNQKALKYFNDYFVENINQMVVLDKVKDFFSKIYAHNYHVAVVTDYSKEVADEILNKLKITTYVSVIIDKDINEGNGVKKAIKCIPNAKNILVICDGKEEVVSANECGAQTCLVSYSDEYDTATEIGVTYIINKFVDLEDIIIE